MSDHELEAFLLASKPIDGIYSSFTQSIMDTITIRHSMQGLSYEKSTVWQGVREYIWRSTLRKVVALALVMLVTACIGLSSYAYANGTDPFSLIKRWIVGEQVSVTYQDPQTNKQRQFAHGAKRNYSDMAISAFAEVNLVDLLHFHASHAYTVPKDGIEYISGDPFRTDYIFPRVGTIEQVTKEHVVVHLTYYMGRSKVEPSRDINERITIPRAYFYYYEEGKLATVQQNAVGKLVEVFQDYYLRHKQHSGEQPTLVDLYSVFALTHPLAAIKEATTTKGPTVAYTDEELKQVMSERDIYELEAGAWTEVCGNNGADTCPHAFSDKPSDNLYVATIVPGDYGGPSRQNPNTIPFGEEIAVSTPATRQYKMRQIEGRIVKIDNDRITLKTSSGALWTFQYSVEHQRAFATAYGRPLMVGQLLAGGVIASVYDWDRRDFENQYVFGMSRYR